MRMILSAILIQIQIQGQSQSQGPFHIPIVIQGLTVPILILTVIWHQSLFHQIQNPIRNVIPNPTPSQIPAHYYQLSV